MRAQVITLLLFAALATGVVAEFTPCSNILENCTNTFNEEKYDDWDALTTYNDCVDAVDCPDDAYATDMRQALLDDITSKQKNWGRNWNIRDSSPHQRPALAVLAIPVFVIFRISIL